MHQLLSAETGGVPLVPLTWTLFKDLITPHPLGGCNMGTSRDDGVVDHKGEVVRLPEPLRRRRRHHPRGARRQSVAHDRRAGRAHRRDSRQRKQIG